jgi:phenylpropionate dioxygenase-like ring-hydroxylating dioxygenase large terminal subunit
MAYVRNAWYVGAWASELDETNPLPMKILGDRIVIYRTESGKIVALEDRCVHRLAPLSLGRCEGERLRCMYHGMLFDTDGKVVEIPGQDLIPAQARVRTYPVVERDSWIWIWMGDIARADDALIPAAVGLDSPDYMLGHGQLDYEAEAQLINENLLDFSHIAYVHAESFGLGSVVADTHAKVTPLPRGIRYERWMENLAVNAAGLPDTPLDAFMTYDYVIPGILTMSFASFPQGTARRMNYEQAPNMSEAIRDAGYTSQAVTPMGDKKTRYFFSTGPYKKLGNEAMLEAMVAVTWKAFREDKVMIEGQQQVIDDTPDMKIMPSAHDRTVTIFNRLVEKLAREGSDIAA